MVEIIVGVVGTLFILLLSLLGIQKKQTGKEKAAKEEAQQEVKRLQVVTEVQQQVDVIKDDLVEKKQDLVQEKEKVEDQVEAIPEEETNELSESVKKLAAEQSRRSRDRSAARMRDDTAGTDD